MTRLICVGADDVRVAEASAESLGEGVLSPKDYPPWVMLGTTVPGWYTDQGVPLTDDQVDQVFEIGGL